jgi:hypothetical protein
MTVENYIVWFPGLLYTKILQLYTDDITQLFKQKILLLKYPR